MQEKEIMMVAATVNGVNYLTKVSAGSLREAEHLILEWSYYGQHEWSVQACLAFDREQMRTDTFIGAALKSTLIELKDLCAVIEERNKELRERDEAERKAESLRKQIAELQEQLDEVERVLTA